MVTLKALFRRLIYFTCYHIPYDSITWEQTTMTEKLRMFDVNPIVDLRFTKRSIKLQYRSLDNNRGMLEISFLKVHSKNCHLGGK